MNVRLLLISVCVSLNVLLGLVACTKGTSSENQLASEYSMSFSPESPSILEEVKVSVQGPPSRTARLVVESPDGALAPTCNDSAESSTDQNAGARHFSCLFTSVGDYTFTAFIESFSGGEKEFTMQVHVGNAQRFSLGVSQGDQRLSFRSSSATAEGTASLLTDSPVSFDFEDGGESATVIFSDGARYAGPSFSHIFSEGGPQAFRVELRNGAGEVRTSREFVVVVRCNGTTVPPVVISDVLISMQANGAYRFTPVAASGTIAGFKLDVNGDSPLDMPWIRTSYRDEYSLLVGSRNISGLAMNRCGDVSSFNLTKNLIAETPGAGRSHVRAKIDGLEGNEELGANVNPFLSMAAQGSVGERRYNFGYYRSNSGGQVIINIDAKHDYTPLTANPHGLHLKFPLPAGLVPAVAGTASATVEVPATQFQYQTAKDGDSNILGRIYASQEAIPVRLTVEKAKVQGSECSPSGSASNRYEIRITGVWDSSVLVENVSIGVAKKVKIEGSFVLFEGQTQNDACTPAPTCIVRPQGSSIRGTHYDSNFYQGVQAQASLEVYGSADSVSFMGQPAAAGMQTFMVPSSPTLSLRAVVSGVGGTSECGPDIATVRSPSVGCVLSAPAQTVVMNGATATASLIVSHAMLHGEGLSAAQITANGGSAQSVLSQLAMPLSISQQHGVGSISIPVNAVGPYNFTATVTAADGSSASCGGGGGGVPKPGPTCTISGPASIEQNTPSAFYLNVANSEYYGSTWSGSMQSSTEPAGAKAVSPTVPQYGVAMMTLQEVKQHNLQATVTYNDDGVTKQINCGKPVQARAISLGCVIYLSEPHSPIYLNDTRTVTVSAHNSDRLGGLKVATINGVNVLSTMSASKVFTDFNEVEFRAHLETNDPNSQTVECSVKGKAQPKPLLCEAQAVGSGTLNHNDSALVRILNIRNLDQHGGSLTDAKIGGVALTSLNPLERMVQFKNTGSSTQYVSVSAEITAADGTKAYCPGAGAAVVPPVPDTPPPPTATCPVFKVTNSSGSQLPAYPANTLIQNVQLHMTTKDATSASVTTPLGTQSASTTAETVINVPASQLPVGSYEFKATVSGPGGTSDCKYRMNFEEVL